jgi:hypothetical protein
MKPYYTRRDLLLSAGRGFGALALSSMLEAAATNPLASKPPHFAPRAKAVIHLFMHGGVSHVDTFTRSRSWRNVPVRLSHRRWRRD